MGKLTLPLHPAGRTRPQGYNAHQPQTRRADRSRLGRRSRIHHRPRNGGTEKGLRVRRRSQLQHVCLRGGLPGRKTEVMERRTHPHVRVFRRSLEDARARQLQDRSDAQQEIRGRTEFELGS